MEQVFLSNIELYYTLPGNVANGFVTVIDDEFHHVVNVMRHKVDDIIYVTDGTGHIFQTQINRIDKKTFSSKIKETYSYNNPFSNFVFCIPRIKNNDRFEFALEKCVELGITNFIVFDSDNSVAKGDKTDKWQKFAVSAMKQSLRSYLPVIGYEKSINHIINHSGRKLFFDQNDSKPLTGMLGELKSIAIDNVYFIFGPEGGFSVKEYELISEFEKVRLTENRLRSETAVVTAAAMISITSV